ncbi:RHS repeat domain-containing protein [Faucicola atlantae]|uniref:RHS repeat domain-containing protein n=1 Tax=Faucicola atlantae TaxID=34059 RepID=UPI00338F092A
MVQLASHIEQKRLADIAYETRRFVRIGESEETINQRIQDKSQPLISIYHYHCNHLGTPQELSDDKGDIVWLSYDRAWGGSFDTIYKPQFIDNWAISESELQPIKFQGQSLDTETGLHYNRFRYYDSDVGMFISRDPIGLLGGSNVFQYAPNPVGWIDPYGLSKFKPVTFPPEQVIEQVTIAMQGSRKRDFKEANRVAGLNGVRGKPTQNAHRDTHGEVTWHHVDYDPVTNTATMQLVTEADHEAKIPHSGSVSEFETTHGVTYGTPEAKKYAKDLNTKLGNNCV